MTNTIKAHPPGQRNAVKRCAIYTRKSTEEGLDQEFNSLHAQREACEAYIQSQRHEGWQLVKTAYDDGGFSGGTMDRPALTQLLDAIRSGTVDIVVVYKVDRLSRSLADFVRLVELLDDNNASFVSVTQQFNTSSSMGRLTLNVLLSFAQFEREVTGERIRDKIAASKQKGMWMGGVVPLGYDRVDKQLVVNAEEAETVNDIFQRYLDIGSVPALVKVLKSEGIVSKRRNTTGLHRGGKPIERGALYALLTNPIYRGMIAHKDAVYEGQHTAIVDQALWDAVQKRMAEHRHERRSQTKVKDPALLSQRLFDDAGKRMRSVHTGKGQKRYRYYASRGWWTQEHETPGTVDRVAAGDIEPVVLETIRRQLEIPQDFMAQLACLKMNAKDQEAVFHTATDVLINWLRRTPQDNYRLIQTAVDRVDLHADHLLICVSRTGLVRWLAPDAAVKVIIPQENALLLEVPVQFKRCGLEKRLIITNQPPEPAHPKTVQALQSSLSRALSWQERLMTGAAPTLAAIARREQVTEARVRQILDLASLAPDIMTSICTGEIPHTFSMASLKDGIPLDWDEQRQRFGFPPVSVLQ